jgi:hypothetical protein
MVAFLYRMPAGFPGAASRKENYTSEPQYIDATNALTAPLAFGGPVKTVAGLMRALAVGDSTSLITGFLERSYPGGASIDPLGTFTAPTNGLMTRIKRGYFTIILAYGTAAKDAPVYFRTTAGTGPTRPPNQFEAAFDGAAATTPNGAGGGGANTGNGTFTVGPTSTGATQAGAYALKMLTATTFSMTDPSGAAMPNGATGVAYSGEGLSFTLTAGGTPFVAGDGFLITNTVRAGAIPGAYFMGPADAAGNVEIAYNI